MWKVAAPRARAAPSASKPENGSRRVRIYRRPMNAEHVLVESSLVPDAKTISAARRIVDDISSQVLADPDLGWRLAMAAHELLDNARKYGREGCVYFRLTIDL